VKITSEFMLALRPFIIRLWLALVLYKPFNQNAIRLFRSEGWTCWQKPHTWLEYYLVSQTAPISDGSCLCLIKIIDYRFIITDEIICQQFLKLYQR